MVSEKKHLNCAIYTRKSSDEGLEQEFNSLHAQREACEAFILSQRHEGWKTLEDQYDDGGFSGGNMERPALKRLLQDIRSGKVNVIVVYKVDRLTRSLSDFAKIVEVLDGEGVSFVSVTQQFNTTSSMGRLTLNVLLSFAQFEREVTGERIRDKIAASKRKGMWMGGPAPIGYDLKERRLVINEAEAETVRTIYRLYIECGSVAKLQAELKRRRIFTKVYTYKTGQTVGGRPFFRGHLYELLNNRLYLGEIVHKGQYFPGQHSAIIDTELWDQVQALFAKNAVNRKFAVGVKYPSLVAGFIYDDRGNRLTPSHTQRGSVINRYYICQAIPQNQPDKVGSIRRVPAREIESLIKNEIEQLLSRELDLCDQLLGRDPDVDTKHQLVTSVKTLRQTLIDDENNLLPLVRTIVSKVVIGPERVDITFNKTAFLQKLQMNVRVSEENKFQVSVAVRLTRSGRRRRLIIAGHSGQPKQVRDDLIKTLARGFKWEEQVRSGSSLEKIAKAEKISRTYIGRVMRLAFLAPDIVESIMDGRQPAHLKTKQLLLNLPIDWIDQRRVLGFPAR